MSRASTGGTGTAKPALFHNGTKLDEEPQPGAIFDVPAATGSYRAETEHSRNAEVSTKVSGTWTSKAMHTTEVTPAAHRGPLPIPRG